MNDDDPGFDLDTGTEFFTSFLRQGGCKVLAMELDSIQYEETMSPILDTMIDMARIEECVEDMMDSTEFVQSLQSTLEHLVSVASSQLNEIQTKKKFQLLDKVLQLFLAISTHQPVAASILSPEYLDAQACINLYFMNGRRVKNTLHKEPYFIVRTEILSTFLMFHYKRNAGLFYKLAKEMKRMNPSSLEADSAPVETWRVSRQLGNGEQSDLHFSWGSRKSIRRSSARELLRTLSECSLNNSVSAYVAGKQRRRTTLGNSVYEADSGSEEDEKEYWRPHSNIWRAESMPQLGVVQPAVSSLSALSGSISKFPSMPSMALSKSRSGSEISVDSAIRQIQQILVQLSNKKRRLNNNVRTIDTDDAVIEVGAVKSKKKCVIQ